MVDSLVDEYVQDELSAEERDCADQYFFTSAKRRHKLEFARALNQRKAELSSRKHARRKVLTFYLPLAASILVVLGLSFGAWRTYSYQRDLKTGLSALEAAFREQRPIESRISDFDYAPVIDTRGGAPRVDYYQRDLAQLALLNAVRDYPGADTHHALGKYYLVEHQFDRAIEQFEKALQFDPRNARGHCDLGAGLLERGKIRASGSHEDFGRSLDHLNQALALDASLLEALFNRALLYRQMRLLDQAANDWRQYFERDSNSQWADEARRQLTELEKQRNKASRDHEQTFQNFLNAYERGDDGTAWEVIRQNYTSAGNTITNTLLDAYLDLGIKGDAIAADNRLQALEYLGKLESQRAGDTYTSDLGRFYRGSNLQRRRALARARSQMKKAYELFLSSHVNDALSQYQQAKQAFDENGDEGEAIFAEYRMGHCYWLQPDLKRSEAIFTRLRSVAERRNYKWLFNQGLYRTASIRFANNEYSESIEYAERALKQSEQMKDTIGILNLLTLLSDQYRVINNQRQSLDLLQRAWILTGEAGAEPLQVWGIFTAIALNLKSLGLNAAALEYQKEAVRLALEMEPERNLLISRSYDYLGLTYASLKDYDSALKNIGEAFEAGRKLSGERSGVEMMANTSLHAGDLYRLSSDYYKAVESYERSIQLYEQLDYPYFTYPARKGKLLSYIARGDDAATEAELQSVLQIFEEYRSKLTKESQRNTFFDVEQSVYDLAIDFAWSKKHDYRQAFEYSERSRARSLLDAVRRTTPPAQLEDLLELSLNNTSTLPLSEIQQKMPEQAQIVQYAVLNEKLMIWVVSRTGVSPPLEVTVSSLALSEKVQAYLRTVNRPSSVLDAETEKCARELYNLLVKPVEPLLDRTKLLCIVPDKILHYLPFGALISAGAGRYLVEDFRRGLLVSSSSTIFVECSGRASQKQDLANERLLSVGDPTFDSNSFRTLQRLPEAASEAEAITNFYEPHRLLIHNDANERAVKTEIVNSNLAHFALHYVVDERSSLFSKMVLAAGPAGAARDPGNDGIWQVHEIYKMKLPQMRLVVLSACQTGIEQQYGGEGAISVARPFIAAGAPLVVASLWPVDSPSTERLMVNFHRYRTNCPLSSAEALRQAQMDLLRGDDSRYRHPFYWAAFTAVGGYTGY